MKIKYILIILILILIISACNMNVFIDPQIPTGGINSSSVDLSPAYSGDGRYLAFASDRHGQRDIFLYDLQQKTLVSLPNLNRRDSSQDQPSLNSDGSYLAYISNERGKTDVLVYNRQSQRATLITGNVKGTVARPALSGDGKQVAFQTSQNGQWKIAIATVP